MCVRKLSNQIFLCVINSIYIFYIWQTYVAKVLIAINPFRQISGLYSERKIINYRTDLNDELPPHLYAIGMFRIEHNLVDNMLSNVFDFIII